MADRLVSIDLEELPGQRLPESVRDEIGNLFITGRNVVTTAAGTTTLGVGDYQTQVFTGTSTQTVKLPSTSVTAGMRYNIINQSTGDVTVQSSAGNTIAVLAGATNPEGVTFVALKDAPTSEKHWRAISNADPITPERFGAVGDGTLDGSGTDDTNALNACFAAAAGKKILLGKNKIYKHTGILTIGQDCTEIDGNGATLLATVETVSEVLISGKYVTVNGLTIKLSASTTRYNEYEKQKLRVTGDYCKLRDVLIDTSSAAGVYTMAGYFDYRNVRAKNTKADGFFSSEGAHDGRIENCVAENPGDDGFSVVSYAGTPCHHIVNTDCRVINGGARGFSVVGGHHIEYLDPQVEGCKSAGIYIGAEGDSYEHITNVTVANPVLYTPNNDPGDDHGGIMITAWDARNIQDINIFGGVVRDVPSARSANIRVIRYNTSTISGLNIKADIVNGPVSVVDLVSVSQSANNIQLDVARNGVKYYASAVPGTATIATSGGTTAMTVSDPPVQIWTGATTQTVQLPSTGVVAGRAWTIINTSSGNVTVQSSAGNQILILGSGITATFVAVQATPTSAAHWNGQYFPNTNMTSSATATALALRDSNANLKADAFIASTASTATASATTTLTIDSAQTQIFTGTTTQTVKLPTTGVVAGQQYVIVNQSTGTVTVQSSGGNTITTLVGAADPTAKVFIALTNTPTTDKHWRAI